MARLCVSLPEFKQTGFVAVLSLSREYARAIRRTPRDGSKRATLCASSATALRDAHSASSRIVLQELDAQMEPRERGEAPKDDECREDPDILACVCSRSTQSSHRQPYKLAVIP